MARRGGEEEAHRAVVAGPLGEARVVVQHRRHDAGRPVGRGGDHAAAGGVLLVDRERVEIDPVHHVERVVRSPGGGQLTVELGRAPPDLEPARRRGQGYRGALKAAGTGVDPALMRVGGYRPDLADRPAHELLSMPDRPTAIFAANDLSAIRTMEVARELGLRVPEDISVIGFDNVPESALTDPPLTTVAQPIHQMGAEALGMVTDLIRGVPREPHLRLPTSLIRRGSCRAPRGATS